ncbi:MAG: hypothetical protein ABIP55_12380 [Tepidisphaeraceae bacterium]
MLNEHNALTKRQLGFLAALHDSGKTAHALMEDMRIAPRELRGWNRDREFREALEDVFASLAFRRETDIRVGATEAMRRSRLGAQGHHVHVSARQQASDKMLLEQARELDAAFPRRDRARQASAAPETVPAKFREAADRLAERIEALRRKGMVIPPGLVPPE